MELLFTVLLIAFACWVIRLWLTEFAPKPARIIPLMRRWGTSRAFSEETDKARWDAAFAAADIKQGS